MSAIPKRSDEATAESCHRCGGSLLRIRPPIAAYAITMPLGVTCLAIAAAATCFAVLPQVQLWRTMRQHEREIDTAAVPHAIRKALGRGIAIGEADLASLNKQQRAAIDRFHEAAFKPWFRTMMSSKQLVETKARLWAGQTVSESPGLWPLGVVTAGALLMLIARVHRGLWRLECIGCAARGSLRKTVDATSTFTRRSLKRDRQTAAQKRIQAVEDLLSTQSRIEEEWARIMNVNEKIILSKWEHEAGDYDASVQTYSGCEPDDVPLANDRKIVQSLHRLHMTQHAFTGTWDRVLSQAIAVYLFGYLIRHGQRRKGASPTLENRDGRWSVLPLQNIALAIYFEACGCDRERFEDAHKGIKAIGGFPDELDWNSAPIQRIMTRTWTSSQLVAEYLNSDNDTWSRL